jgi:outer membrane protein assembly factor BamA
LLIFTTLLANGQKHLQVVYTEMQPEVQSIIERQKIKSVYKSVKKIERRLEILIKELRRNNFISASLDTIRIENDTCFAEIFIGEKIQFQQIVVEEISQEELQTVKIEKRLLKQAFFSMEDVFLYNKMLANHLWNRGYPFATVQNSPANFAPSEKIFIPNRGIVTVRKVAKVIVEKNNFIRFDSIIVVGNLKLSKRFCYGYLSLKQKSPYNESLVKDIPVRMHDLPFANLLRPPSVSFSQDKAVLFIYADKQKNNQFDGYLGVVPKDETSGKVLLTGSLTLELNNVFTVGETLKLNWKHIQVQSPNLDISADFPYLFASPFGIDGAFQLEKKDTNYLNLNLLVGIRYFIRKNNYLRAYYQFKNSRLSSISALLSNIDYDANLYGLELHWQKLDYLFNPRKGYVLGLNTALGQRVVRKNAHIADALYQELQLSSLQWQLTGKADIYCPIKKRWVWYSGLKGGYLYGTQLFENELFKLGGLKTLRGFDEQSIFASSYIILNQELRYIFGKRSYFQFFLDIATLEKNTAAEYVFDVPFGFGAGISFDTKAGILSLNYALGRQMNNPIRIASGKITFGYAAVF